MENKLAFLGLDVDDKRFHGFVVNKSGGQISQFSCKPTVSHLLAKICKLKTQGYSLKTCYEATYLGFSLQRKLQASGVECEVIAPSLIPKTSADKVKTNRLDSIELAKLFSAGLLTKVQAPNPDEEAVRDLTRTREFLTSQMKRLKTHILSTLRRYGIDYRLETGLKSYWTTSHYTWLRKKINNELENLKFNITTLLNQLLQLQGQIKIYDEQLFEIAETKAYKTKVEALCCYRGINVLTAMLLITEIGDIKRFNHPKKLTSYCGLDIAEYSSGKEKRFGITKTGNAHIRKRLVESVQKAGSKIALSKRLKNYRKSVPEKYNQIADRCMARLYKKSSRLFVNKKHTNKIKVACARELLCFIWESLQEVEKVSLG